MDERLLAGIRRYWTREEVDTAYAAVLEAYGNAAVREVSIIGSSFDGGGANGTYVLDREAMAVWMDVLEARLQEIKTGGAPLVSGSPVVNFSTRIVGT